MVNFVITTTSSLILLLLLHVSSAFLCNTKSCLNPTRRMSSLEELVEQYNQREKQQPKSKPKTNKTAKQSEKITLDEFMIQRDATNKKQPKQQTNRKQRTRKRQVNPQQQYVYQSKRTSSATTETNNDSPSVMARSMGLNCATQYCDADPHEQPTIVGTLKVSSDDDSDGSSTKKLAYLIEKPAGWSILDTKPKQKPTTAKTDTDTKPTTTTKAATTSSNSSTKKLKYFDEQSGVFDWLDYNEQDILSLLTPKERTQFDADGGMDGLARRLATPNPALQELAAHAKTASQSTPAEEDTEVVTKEDTEAAAVVREKAVFTRPNRPSIVSWLKSTKAAEGILVRGGTNWKALVGAVHINDSGLVLLCPKGQVTNVCVEETKYLAVVGTGGYLAPLDKNRKPLSTESTNVSVEAKIKKGRVDDTVIVSKVSVQDQVSHCSDVIPVLQKEYKNGIRGDATANPLDRRAPRRLLHCSFVAASSLVQDDFVAVELPTVPNDITVYSERRNHHTYNTGGSFLGRHLLRDSHTTNAYREINGAADGFPGWIVDRYDQWLVIQHHDDHPSSNTKGPLPSIHDGNTVGIYYMKTKSDRSTMKDNTVPVLYQGQPIPTGGIQVKENGIQYQVDFDGFSTGLFLDQRPQRQWLATHCTADTKVLNCFAHCGAFSVAAATAGASTTSLDLNQEFLSRIEPQLLANGITNFNTHHDCIYGDCIDWLERLAKRGEQYDLVILDPPSTSVSVGKKGKKRRWSVKNDYDALVALASKLVKPRGLLWTTTNLGSMSPSSFARTCQKGILPGTKLQSVTPMPIDFPSIGAPTVKNFAWRLP